MLRVLCVDDEELMLRHLVSLCAKTAGISETHGFDKAGKALAWVREHPCDLALLDMESALKLTPQDPYAYVTRAAIYLRMGRHKRQARADLDRAMQLGLSRADLADLYNKL